LSPVILNWNEKRLYIKHMKRYAGVFALTLLLAQGTGSAASREQQEMQRDIAQLQDQIRMLQSTFDQKMATMQTLVEQALEAGNKANTNVSVLNSSVTQTLDRELKGALVPVTGLAARVGNIANDVSDVKNSIADLNTQLNRQHQLLTDINNAIKVLQSPAAAPPPSGVPSASAAPPPAAALWTGASSDYSSGKADLAAQEYADFLRYYPDDPNAAQAQFLIGQIHSAQGKYDQAVMDFDAVLERYPDNKYTTDAYFMKGMALKVSGHRDAAVTEFRALIKKYPRSDRATEAADQLRSMGLSPAATSSAAAAGAARHKK
jgi:TolA-binding protein